MALAYVRSLRRRNPEATPEQLIKIIRRHYLTLTTSGGAAVGATAAVPGLGTTAALGVATAETAGFLEGTALFAQAISEIHGLPVQDAKRANALVLGLMLGKDGENLVQKFGKQSGGTESMFGSWGSTVTKQLPAPVVDLLVRKLRKTFVRKFAARAGGSLVGRRCPSASARSSAVWSMLRWPARWPMSRPRPSGPHLRSSRWRPTPSSSRRRTSRKLLAGLKNIAALRGKIKKNKAIESDVIDEAAEEDLTAPDALPRTYTGDDHPELGK